MDPDEYWWNAADTGVPGIRDFWEGQPFTNDVYAAALFDIGFMRDDVTSNERKEARDWLDDYIMETYGLEWDEVMDWDAFREYYDAA